MGFLLYKGFSKYNKISGSDIYTSTNNEFNIVVKSNKVANFEFNSLLTDIILKNYGNNIYISNIDDTNTEFLGVISGLDYDKNNYSEDRALKKAFKDAYDKNGVGPGQDKMKEVLKKYRDRKAKQDEKETAVLDNIADMLFNEKFQNLLQHSTPKEIDSKVQAFLA